MKKALITLLLPIISLSTHAQSETPQQCIESFFVAFHQKSSMGLLPEQINKYLRFFQFMIKYWNSDVFLYCGFRFGRTKR